MSRLRIILLATVLTLIAAAPARAAGNPYTPTGVCGPGFGVIGHHDVTGPKGGVLATAYLLWNRSSKRNCSVLIKRRAVGISTWAEVSLAKTGGRYMTDDGFFQYYAGPLYVRAPHTCVIYGGRMRDAKNRGGAWITPWPVHCG